MNCEQFRIRYNRWLDDRQVSTLDQEMVGHAQICPGCRSYAQALLDIDAGLRHIPDVQVPEEMLAAAKECGSRGVRVMRNSSIASCREMFPVLAAIAAWMITLLLPDVWQSATQVVLVAGAASRCAVTSLRPRLLA